MKRKVVTKIITIALALMMVMALTVAMTSCTQADSVQYNMRQNADNFNITRKITVINVRNDTVLLEMTGTMSISVDIDGDLNILCEIADGTYQQHFIHLNQWVTYVVEDISNTAVNKYSYELNILPALKPRVDIVVQD